MSAATFSNPLPQFEPPSLAELQASSNLELMLILLRSLERTAELQERTVLLHNRLEQMRTRVTRIEEHLEATLHSGKPHGLITVADLEGQVQ